MYASVQNIWQQRRLKRHDYHSLLRISNRRLERHDYQCRHLLKISNDRGDWRDMITDGCICSKTDNWRKGRRRSSLSLLDILVLFLLADRISIRGIQLFEIQLTNHVCLHNFWFITHTCTNKASPIHMLVQINPHMSPYLRIWFFTLSTYAKITVHKCLHIPDKNV